MKDDEIVTKERSENELNRMAGESIDYKNEEAYANLLTKKDLAIERRKKNSEKWFNKWVNANSELTDVKSLLSEFKNSKERYKRELMKANKIVVQANEKESSPTDGFLDNLISRIGLK